MNAKVISLCIFILIVSFSFYNCSTSSKIDKYVITYVYDFTKYTHKGFLFTAETYRGDYESIGLLEVEIYPGSEKKPLSEEKKSKQYGTSDYGKSEERIYWPIKTEELLDSLYNLAINMGADAIINLSINDFQVNYGITYAYGRRASGFAIKRKGAFK